MQHGFPMTSQTMCSASEGGVGVAGAGLAISLLWIYTEGKLDSKSVSAALPVIQVRSEIVKEIRIDKVICAGRCGGIPDDSG